MAPSCSPILFILLLMYATKVTSFSLYSKKTALITGSTDGIGVTTAKNLAASGFNVIIHGRNSLRIEKAVEDIRSFLKDESTHSESQIYQVEADISTVDGCYCLVRDVQSILANNNLDLDVLMNNAGVFEQDHIITKDELEMTFAVNVMAPFVITSNLLNNLLKEKSKQSRIVIASSMSQCHNIEDWDDLNFKRRQYSAHRAYSESKLFDAMLTAEFATRLQVEGIATNTITCNSLDPGTVNTKMLLAGWGPCGIKVESALDQTWLCSSEETADITGAYFNGRRVSRYSSDYKASERQKLWSILSQIDPNSAQVVADICHN